MIPNKSLKTNCSELVTAPEYQLNIAPVVINTTVKSTSSFSFINVNQWILLLLLNSICLSFIAFACLWID